MTAIIFGATPPLPKRCLTCKQPKWQWNEHKQEWICLTCTIENPCVAQYGPGPEGKSCGDCKHLHGFKQSAAWYKCELRQWKSKGGKNRGTVYPGGDHRVRWPACTRFEPIQEDKS